MDPIPFRRPAPGLLTQWYRGAQSVFQIELFKELPNWTVLEMVHEELLRMEEQLRPPSDDEEPR